MPDLSDCPPAKLSRGDPAMRIGDPGPRAGSWSAASMATTSSTTSRRCRRACHRQARQGLLLRHCAAVLLQAAGITSLIVTGVTTEVCVHTTVREANDRGYECLVLSDCTGSYFPEFQRDGLAMIAAQGGIFGWVAPSSSYLAALRIPQGADRAMTVTAPATLPLQSPLKLPLWTSGDTNAFFGLGFNVMVNVLVLTGLCLGVVHIPAHDVYGVILPAMGIQLLIGNVYYTYLARRLARRESRDHVTAMPYGPSVPHMFIVTFVIMLPTYLARRTRSTPGPRAWPGASSSAASS